MHRNTVGMRSPLIEEKGKNTNHYPVGSPGGLLPPAPTPPELRVGVRRFLIVPKDNAALRLCPVGSGPGSVLRRHRPPSPSRVATACQIRPLLRQPWLDLIARMIYPEAMSMTHLTAQQLHRAAEIREKIENLEKDFVALLAVTGDAPVTVRRRGRPAKSVVAPATPTSKPKRKVSKAGRARLSAAAKKRWAKVKAAGKTRL